MYFRRKAYDKLMEWKQKYADQYAILLEGARRVGKSTIAEEFAKKEYESYILIDFANVNKDIIDCFNDIHNLDLFFLRIQTITGTQLIKHRSVIIFDEVQLFPKARQAIKYLVKDGRYHYIETGSLISIKKNVKDILIPSEEMKLPVYPMDYEEFLWVVKPGSYQIIEDLYRTGKSIGQAVHRTLMRNFRIYMAVGGMPQAVQAYIDGKSFAEIDSVKRSIIQLYEDDFRKIDPSGKIAMLYHSIPGQLSKGFRRFAFERAVGKKKTNGDEQKIFDLIDSRTVLVCYNTTEPRVSLSLTKDIHSYKMYSSDTGLFVTLMFIDRPAAENELYKKFLSDKLPANLGYLYENAVAQMIAAGKHELYYHTWEKENSTHYYEADFLLANGAKVNAVEVKSSGSGKHESLTVFKRKYSDVVNECFVISQKDVGFENGIRYLPVYMVPFLVS